MLPLREEKKQKKRREKLGRHGVLLLLVRRDVDPAGCPHHAAVCVSFKDYWMCSAISTFCSSFILLHLFHVFHRYSCWTYGTFKRLGVPGPSPIPFFGTMLKYRKVGNNTYTVYTVYTAYTAYTVSTVDCFKCMIPILMSQIHTSLWTLPVCAVLDQWTRLRCSFSLSTFSKVLVIAWPGSYLHNDPSTIFYDL